MLLRVNASRVSPHRDDWTVEQCKEQMQQPGMPNIICLGSASNHTPSATFPLEIAPALLAGHEFGDKQVVFIIPE